ncbi:MAG: hypothetical protein ABIS68_10725 [Casimicrobiaceae bacterium]
MATRSRYFGAVVVVVVVEVDASGIAGGVTTIMLDLPGSPFGPSAPGAPAGPGTGTGTGTTVVDGAGVCTTAGGLTTVDGRSQAINATDAHSDAKSSDDFIF